MKKRSTIERSLIKGENEEWDKPFVPPCPPNSVLFRLLLTNTIIICESAMVTRMDRNSRGDETEKNNQRWNKRCWKATERPIPCHQALSVCSCSWRMSEETQWWDELPSKLLTIDLYSGEWGSGIYLYFSTATFSFSVLWKHGASWEKKSCTPQEIDWESIK